MAHLVPYLAVHDGAAALDFYAAAFGARVAGETYREPDGRIGHATIVIGDDVLYVSDEFHEFGAYSPRTLGHGTAALVLTVEDVEHVFARAVAADATIDREPSGDPDTGRRGWLIDPFGHRWAIEQPPATHVR